MATHTEAAAHEHVVACTTGNPRTAADRAGSKRRGNRVSSNCRGVGRPVDALGGSGGSGGGVPGPPPVRRYNCGSCWSLRMFRCASALYDVHTCNNTLPVPPGISLAVCMSDCPPNWRYRTRLWIRGSATVSPTHGELFWRSMQNAGRGAVETRASMLHLPRNGYLTLTLALEPSSACTVVDRKSVV